jgi:hypothetical protein
VFLLNVYVVPVLFLATDRAELLPFGDELLVSADAFFGCILRERISNQIAVPKNSDTKTTTVMIASKSIKIPSSY